MAEDSIALLELVEKYADGDLFRELGQFALQRLMEIEAEQHVGAGKHERSGDRNTHRNDYSSPADARRRIGEYIEMYNSRRPHGSLGGITPNMAYAIVGTQAAA